jgi:NADH-quinone oxidoreductase subunit N
MKSELVLNLRYLLPEFLVAGAALAVVATEVLLPAGRRARATSLTAIAGLLAALVLVVLDWTNGVRGEALKLVGTSGALVTAWTVDPFSLFTRGLALVGGLLVALLAIPYTRRMDKGHGEFYAVFLFALLGVMLLSGVSDLLSLFVCLELVTISSYVLAAFRRNDLKSTEAGLKYLVVGSVSSALLLLGIAFVYGATGALSFPALAGAVAVAAPDPMLVLGASLLLVGVLFKVGGVPFHVWIPDVYEGAPSPVAAFLSTASKSAGMVLLLRLAQVVLIPAAGRVEAAWLWLLVVLAGVTLLFGLLGAIPQRRIKRLLGYSSIGHAGYLLAAVAAMSAGGAAEALPGATAILFYLGAFFFTNLTAFMVIVLVSAVPAPAGVSAWAGLSRRAPFLGLAMALALLSLAGVPPLSGFFSKFLVLNAVVANANAQPILWVLAGVGALGILISLYFYLLWILEMYFKPPEPALASVGVRVGAPAAVVLWVGILAMLAMGIFMGPVYAWAEDAAKALIAAL